MLVTFKYRCTVYSFIHLFVCGADARSQHTDLSGGDSPLTVGSLENSGVVERRFAGEPLYQFYTAAVVEVSCITCETSKNLYISVLSYFFTYLVMIVSVQLYFFIKCSCEQPCNKK